MTTIEVSSCRCLVCQQPGDPPERELHRQMILLVSRLDEQQRRWFAAVESKRIGHGGDALLSQITGLDEATIRRGREELAASLVDRPVERVRLPGGGRPPAEKKIRRSRRS
jgi:hypothetical protein